MPDFIWWVEDYLSGEVFENKYYPTHEDAIDAREALGYGLIKGKEVVHKTGCGICPAQNACPVKT